MARELTLINRAPSAADGSDHIMNTKTTGSSSWGTMSVFVAIGAVRVVEAEIFVLATKEGG
jgi:hypothetical protein